MLLRQRILLIGDGPAPPAASTGALSESVVATSTIQNSGKLSATRVEGASALVTFVVSPVALDVLSPGNNSSVGFPFIATGIATRGATVRVYNTVSGALLGTATADIVTGNWSIPISSL